MVYLYISILNYFFCYFKKFSSLFIIIFLIYKLKYEEKSNWTPLTINNLSHGGELQGFHRNSMNKEEVKI